MLSQELVLVVGITVVNRGLQGGERGVGALGQVVVLGPAEDGPNLVQLGTVDRQEIAVDALCPQLRQGVRDDPAAMQAGVAEHNHQRDRAGRPLQKKCTRSAPVETRGEPIQSNAGCTPSGAWSTRVL